MPLGCRVTVCHVLLSWVDRRQALNPWDKHPPPPETALDQQRRHAGHTKDMALDTDCTPRHCACASPFHWPSSWLALPTARVMDIHGLVYPIQPKGVSATPGRRRGGGGGLRPWKISL